jgi:hypothetical protein
VRTRLSRLTWKLLLYLVVAVLIGGLTQDRMLTGLLTAGFVVGDASVATILLARTAIDRRDGKGRGQATGTRARPS